MKFFNISLEAQAKERGRRPKTTTGGISDGFAGAHTAQGIGDGLAGARITTEDLLDQAATARRPGALLQP